LLKWPSATSRAITSCITNCHQTPSPRTAEPQGHIEAENTTENTLKWPRLDRIHSPSSPRAALKLPWLVLTLFKPIDVGIDDIDRGDYSLMPSSDGLGSLTGINDSFAPRRLPIYAALLMRSLHEYFRKA
jgi:hypothetical protein